MTDPLRNNPQNHRAINIGDIFKDADANPHIRDKNKLSKLIEEIVSQGTAINYREDTFKFNETKKFIVNLLLPEVRKYSYSNLPSIPETSQSSSLDDPTKISKENRNILPNNIKYFFIDAAMNPNDYKNKDLTEIEIVETLASFMDPAKRSPPKTTLFDLDKSIAHIDLKHYGFQETCYVKLLAGSTKEIMYIEIGLNNLLLQCKIDRNGLIKRDKFKFINIDSKNPICDFDIVEDIFFQGNPKKNKYINENIDSSNDKEKNISIMLLLLKELGDTMQAIILEKILQEASKGGNDLGYYLGNSCLLTNDTVLATRCSMLSVPFLLKHNYILTSYQPPINEVDKKLIQIVYDRNQKLQEIDRIILNNEGVINGLKEFLNKLFNDEKIKSIKLSSQTSDDKPIKNRLATFSFIENIIRKIENANEKLREILEIIINDLNSVDLILKGIAPDPEKQQYNQNLINICKAEFYIFRTYIYQSNAIKLFKRIEIDTNNESNLLSECYGSTTKTYLFKTKIPNKLYNVTSNITDGFSLIDEYNNEIFENGFMNKLETLVTDTQTKGGSSRKNITNSVSGEDIYIKVYPYIYCYPWLIEYIFDNVNNPNINKFIDELITNDIVNPILLNNIFSINNENKYYRLSLYNNIYYQVNLPVLKSTLVYKLREYIETNFKLDEKHKVLLRISKSLSLPRKSNKPISRRAKSEPKNQRSLTRKIKGPRTPRKPTTPRELTTPKKSTTSKNSTRLKRKITPTKQRQTTPTRATTPETRQSKKRETRATTPEKSNTSKKLKTKETSTATRKAKRPR
tara:strand:- start:1752 stop:4151 length:2400 start_codon:yes stop_codon:yes gene_type:complete